MKKIIPSILLLAVINGCTPKVSYDLTAPDGSITAVTVTGNAEVAYRDTEKELAISTTK